MAQIPTAFIEQVRGAVDIVDLVSQYVPLKRAGKNFKGLCPFHREKTPSFNVSPDRQIFHCFGCGQGGDAFKFLMLYENASFTEAVRTLAERAGLPMPRSRAGGADRDERALTLRLHEEAARFFRERLLEHPSGRAALDYLARRGLDRASVEEYGLGWAPDEWSALLERLTRRGARPEEIARAGLAVPRKDGSGYYDRFRGRVMIPIRNEAGTIVAFGGRLLGDGEPKYLNSPETIVYSKSRILFGFDRAKKAIREEGSAILMEGYLDCLQAYRAGIANAVACCGTSLTSAHARLLRRFTERVVLNFDADAAGERAALRSIDVLLEEGFEVLALRLPAGHDPDRFLREHGAEAYRQRLAAAPGFVDYLIERAATRHDVTTPRGKAGLLNEVLPTLARIPNHVERVAYVGPLAERAGIADAAVVEELRRQVLARTSRIAPRGETAGRLRPAERDLVRWLLERPAEAPGLLAELDEEDFRETVVGPILRAMTETTRSAELTTERVLERLASESHRALLTRIALEPAPLGPRQSPRDCLNRLREERWRRQLSRLRERLAQGDGDDDRLVAEIQSLARRIENLGRVQPTA